MSGETPRWTASRATTRLPAKTAGGTPSRKDRRAPAAGGATAGTADMVGTAVRVARPYVSVMGRVYDGSS